MQPPQHQQSGPTAHEEPQERGGCAKDCQVTEMGPNIPPRKAVQVPLVAAQPGAAAHGQEATQGRPGSALPSLGGRVSLGSRPKAHEDLDLCKNWGNESSGPCAIPGVTLCQSGHITSELKAKARKQRQKILKISTLALHPTKTSMY